MADDQAAPPAKSRRGGARKGAGRKPKGHVAPTKLGDIDLKAALDTPAPDDIAVAAQSRARQALEALSKQLMHGASEAAKVTAANAILDRGYGKPTVDVGGDMLLPFMAKPLAALDVATEMRTEARRYANLAIEVLTRIANAGESESARVSAARSLWDRGLGTVATAKVPDSLNETSRPIGKKEEMQRAAAAVATGRLAVPPPPGSSRLQ